MMILLSCRPPPINLPTPIPKSRPRHKAILPTTTTTTAIPSSLLLLLPHLLLRPITLHIPDTVHPSISSRRAWRLLLLLLWVWV